MICEVATRACMSALVAISIAVNLSPVLIFVDHYLGWITALLTIFALCLLTVFLAYFTNSAPSLSHPS